MWRTIEVGFRACCNRTQMQPSKHCVSGQGQREGDSEVAVNCVDDLCEDFSSRSIRVIRPNVLRYKCKCTIIKHYLSLYKLNSAAS